LLLVKDLVHTREGAFYSFPTKRQLLISNFFKKNEYFSKQKISVFLFTLIEHFA
jgi:hypothetical protein